MIEVDDLLLAGKGAVWKSFLASLRSRFEFGNWVPTASDFNGRWVELGGAGLIHPNILENYGIDTEKYSGFAFGLGVERIPMLSYGVDDLRHFLENDLRFLEQFKAEPVEL